ncbi:hypothetical protein [Archangium lansingense]|uniref:Uncharacterized protein n=1 Tax=Archangium lansingense TaxID=2995310 RepID=A0ABT4AAR8_9BACT|nr:hypothetical protein [Archangium lansinium]MCY1078765.1 hypothetical protein [Archangium lansinium]
MSDRNADIQAVLKRLAQEYADDPNIQTIGFGLRTRGGTLTRERVIIFFVKRKYGSARQLEAAGSSPIPKEIDGFATDVQEFNIKPSAAGDRDDKEFDPLLGGVATSNATGHIFWFNSSGTLGMLVRDETDGTPMALSNWHVWANGGDEGDDIIQPGHPTGGDHVEAIGKVAACGPLSTSLIEWEAPSPLTVGLYGGAAAAAVAAAASDVRDPSRRGQDQTPTNPGELTELESVDMAIEYPQLPLPGVAFHTQVKWRYERKTSARVLHHEVEETQINTQFLLGKMVTTQKTHYRPGETVALVAALWDYQPRACHAYHVVAHLISQLRPNTALRVVLHPTSCPRTLPVDPPRGEAQDKLCVTFEGEKLGEYPPKGQFAWLRYLDVGQEPVRVVNWLEPLKALTISSRTLLLEHVPARMVVVTVAQFTRPPITAVALNAAGQVLDQKTAPEQQATAHELTLQGEGIVRVVLRGGGGEGVLISYCIEPIHAQSFTTPIAESTAASVRREIPRLELTGPRLKVNRCCFSGSIALPPDEPPGKWDVYLTVQNVNTVPDGTRPEEAATTIGGHLLSSHTSAEILGCTALMLGDHVFDVI